MEKINNWSDYDKMVKKELKGDIVRFEDTYIYQLQEENEKLKKQYCERVDCMGRLGESKKVEELKASVKYYVDILTELKKWLEQDEETIMVSFNYVLNKIKELEEKHNG